MLQSDRHKRVRQEGYQARINNKPMTDNRYSKLGKAGQTYASIWDAGWLDADKSCAENFRPNCPDDQ